VSSEGVVRGEFVIRAELGLHARPAGRFVSHAGRFDCDVFVSLGGPDDEWVNGQSVLSILSLAAAQGTRLHLRAEGVDAKEAVRVLGALLEEVEPAKGPV